MQVVPKARLLFGFPVDLSEMNPREKLEFAENYIRQHALDLQCLRKNGQIVIKKSSARYLDIEWTNHCNARCLFCPREKMPAVGFMKENTFLVLLDKARKANVSKIMCIGRGEPLLHPKALDFVRYIREYTGMSLEIFTNGEVLTPEVTDALATLNDPILDLQINVSLHTLDHKLHRSLVGVNLKKVLRNVRYLIHRSDKLRYSLCFVQNKKNKLELQKLKERLAKRGITKNGISMVYNKGGHVPDGETFDKDFYLESFGVERESDLPEWRLCQYTFDFLSYSVNFRGEFVLCHDDFEDRYKLGNVFEDDFTAIDAKIAALKKQGGAEQCRRCTKYLREAYHGKEKMAKNEITL